MPWQHRFNALCLLVGAFVSALLVGADPVAAATPLMFPTSRAMVPLAVASAFVMPALVAAVFVVTSRYGRIVGPVLGVCVLACAALAGLGFAQPELVVALRQ